MKQSRLRSVSARRAEKRRKLGARGPLCGFAKAHPCAICRSWPTDPAHVERVGQGFGDWLRVAGVWVGRVAPLCRKCHNHYDRNEVGYTGDDPVFRGRVVRAAEWCGEAWAGTVDVDLSDARHPYELCDPETLEF